MPTAACCGPVRLLADKEQIITRTHGTITHMAPEVITEATHSKAADVYSFGVVLFELFSGSKPYHGMHYAQIVSSITSGKLLQLLPQQASHLPKGLLQLMASCLASNPVDRPTFVEVRQRLTQLEEEQLQAGVPDSSHLPAAVDSTANPTTGAPAGVASCGGCQQVLVQSRAAGV